MDTDALARGGPVDTVHALVFAAGSAFGLSAATAPMEPLARDGRGCRDRGPVVPVLAGAVLFDLLDGRDESGRGPDLYARLVLEADRAAGEEVPLGKAGAGFGAVAGPLESGLATASTVDPRTGATVAGLVAVNSPGGARVPGRAEFHADGLAFSGELDPVRPLRASFGPPRDRARHRDGAHGHEDPERRGGH
ncbi:MAG: P1 family peptidase [Geminicoccaceae bacterium]|nr:P1 family peptidase [Geminicoccaceae bacterium]